MDGQVTTATIVGLTFSTVSFLVFGSILISWTSQFQETIFEPTDFINQVSKDWTTTPFTEIVVTDQSRCPNGTDLVFSKPWYGSRLACFCQTGRRAQLEDIDLHWNERVDAWQYSIGRSCNNDETKNGCWTVPAKHPVIMGQFNGKRICGKRGGTPFLDAIRVQRDGSCPDGTSPCVLSKSHQNRICYPKSMHATSCPITDLTMVSEAEVDHYRGMGYTAVLYSEVNQQKSYIVYSKLVDSLPLTSFKMEHKPCLDSWQQSSGSNDTFYATESMQLTCEKEVNTKVTHDPRYKIIPSFFATEASVQQENGVLDLIRGIDSSLFGSSSILDRKSRSQIWPWTRPTIPWKLECEWDGIDRQIGLEAFETRFDDLGNAESLKRFGLFFIMCVIMPILLCLCISVNSAGRDGEGIIFLTLCCFGIGWFLSRTAFCLYFWNIITMTADERQKIEANSEDLKRLETLKLCSDMYTHVDSNRVIADMRKAQHTLDWISYAVWAMLGCVILEIMCIVPAIHKRESVDLTRRALYNEQIE